MEQKIDARFMNGLNPFVKAVAILIAGLILAFSYLVTLNLAVCGLCLVLLLFFSRAAKIFSLIILTLHFSHPDNSGSA